MNEEEELRNDALLDALAAFREVQNPMTEQNFIKALVEGVFVAPVIFSEEPVIKEDGEVDIPENAEMRLLTFEMENGNSVFPIFTDMEAFNASPIDAGEETVAPWAMQIADYLPMLQDPANENIEGLALNPFTNGMPITRENLAYIAGVIAGAEEAQNGESELEIASAEEIVPAPLRYELVGLADDAMGKIETMHLLWLTNKATDTANYLLVFDGPDSDAIKGLFDQFAKAFEAHAGEEGSAVDMVLRENFNVDLSEFPQLYTRAI